MTDRPRTAMRRLRPVGWLLVAVGVCLAALSITMLVTKIGSYVAHDLTTPAYSTPVDETISLRSGNHVVYERTAPEGSVTISPDQVQVIAPDGQSVSTGRPGGRQTITRNGDVFAGAVSFHVPSDGHYEVRVFADETTRVLISRDLGSIVVTVLLWIAGAASGLFIACVGALVLVVGWSQQRRWVARPS